MKYILTCNMPDNTVLAQIFDNMEDATRNAEYLLDGENDAAINIWEARKTFNGNVVVE